MSLRVWLPLNGDLHNQGLSTASLSGSPTWGTGKIGSKSFCCNTGIAGITISDLMNVTTFSVAYWLYVDSSITDFTNYTDFWGLQAVSGDTITVIRDELRTNTANLGRHALHMIKDASVGSNTNTYYGLGERDDAKDKWCHVVITKDANYCDAYANGVRYAHVPCSNFENSSAKLNGKFWLGMGGCKSAYLNDFRIYDHCLSENEIKRLAQGLIVHYPLNRQGLGQDNLLTISNARAISGYQISNLTCTANVSVSEWGCTDAYRCTGSGGTNTIIGTISAGKISNSSLKYSYSVWVKNNHSTKSIAFYPNHNGNYFSGWLAPGQSKRLFVEGAPGNGVSYIQFNWRTNTAGDAFDFTYWHPKIEIGDKVTTWSQSKYDSVFDVLTYDKTLYVEPDGTQWIRIAHHNNPINVLFASTDDFVNGVYKDSNRWYQVEKACNLLNSNEFLIKQKPTSDGTESKYRWIQTKNPIVATHDDVSPSAVTRITTSGYTDGTYGGLYKSSTNRTRLTIADGVAGDWWGALGAWTDYSGGIPGYPKIKVTTGYIDLYIRVDNISVGDSIEYDISGFGNNGTRIGGFTWSSDTPKYEVSTEFNGSNYIKTLPGNFSWSNYDNLTIAAWMKPTTTPTTYIGSIGIAHDGGTSNKAFSISNYGGKFTVHTIKGSYVNTQSTYTCPLNEWHHYVATLDNTTCKMYVDGVLNNTFTIDWGTATNHASPQIQVGVDLPGGDEIYTGYYSDARIYATALSADDVKSLYQNCATIGPDGTIYGQIRN